MWQKDGVNMINAKVQSGITIIPKNEKEIVVELEHPVNLNQAFIVPGGSIYGHGGYGYSNDWDARLVLVGSKHLSIKRAYPSAYETEVAWQIVYWGEPEQEQAPGPEQEIDWDNDIDWERVPVDTAVLIRDDLEEDWEEASFCCSVPEKYMVFNEGYTSGEAVTATFYNYCKLANPEDVEKYKKVKP